MDPLHMLHDISWKALHNHTLGLTKNSFTFELNFAKSVADIEKRLKGQRGSNIIDPSDPSPELASCPYFKCDVTQIHS